MKKEIDKLVAGLLSKTPEFVEPMQCKLVDELPERGEWLYELKWDGYRAIAVKQDKKVQLISRNNKNLNRRYPEIVEAIQQLPQRKLLLDGEVVALDEQGLPSFQRLQNMSFMQPDRQIYFYAFDALNYEGKDLRRLPLYQRKTILQMLIPADSLLRYSANFQADTAAMLVREVQKFGLEGIVAKRRNSLYEAGRRSGAWIKYKTDREQEFVVGGYRASGGADTFELLVIGYFQNGQLQYAAKLRAGFTPHIKGELARRFRTLVAKKCPFANVPESRTGRWGEGLTEEDLGKCVWLKPRVVCRVRFTEWTSSGHLRHAKFVSIRDDKDAKLVVRESSGGADGDQG